MHLLHEPHDPTLLESLQHIVQNAIESPLSNMRVQVGSITLSCTSDALKSQAVTFSKPFRITPSILLVFANPAVTSSVMCVSYASLTKNGFTAQIYTSSTQSVTYSYLALGQV